MNLKLNNNGNTAAELRTQLDQMHTLATNLAKHMGTMDHVHGRNYQTVDDPALHEEDVKEFRALRLAVDNIRLYAASGIADIVRQREGL